MQSTLSDIQLAAQTIVAGELVAFPTETVYGLGADACSDTAVAKIFAAKGRPSDHPLIVHVASPGGVAHFANSVPAFAHQLIATFWPGPLTVILPRKPQVASASAGGQASIGLRCPSHRMALSLLRECQKLGVHGLAAPSANRFGRVSPTTAAHVKSEFQSELQADAEGEPTQASNLRLMILDGGDCEVGIESTIIDCTRGVPVLLRPGVLTLKELTAAAGEKIYSQHEYAEKLAAQNATLGNIHAAPKASGTLESHYAPRAKVRLMDTRILQAALDLLQDDLSKTVSVAVYAMSAVRVPKALLASARHRIMPNDAKACAHDLFAALRALDEAGVSLIWVETPPAHSDWDGVRDRLTRAAA